MQVRENWGRTAGGWAGGEIRGGGRRPPHGCAARAGTRADPGCCSPSPPAPQPPTCHMHSSQPQHSLRCVCVCARNTRDPWDGGLAPPPPPSRPPPSPLPGPVTTQAHDAVPVPAVMARSCWVAVLRTRLLVTTLWKPGGWWLGSVAEPVCLKRCRPVGSNWNPWCFVDAER